MSFQKPVPKPRANEEQQAFVSRCIRTMHHQDPDRPDDQIQAMCYDAWRNRGKGIDILSRLAILKDRLIAVFGDLGRRYFNATLERLGVSQQEDGTFDLSVFKTADILIPFAKGYGDTIEFCDVPLFEHQFIKVDAEFAVVAAYANVPVMDCDADLMFPDDYRESAEAYMRYPAKIHLMHHQTMDAGDILHQFKDKDGHVWKSEIQDIGWFVVSKPYDYAKKMIEEGRLNAYSIAGRFTMRRRTGRLWTYEPNSVKIGDLSFVNSGCNKLCFYDLVKSEHQIPEAPKREASSERFSLEEQLEWSLLKNRTLIFHGEVYERSCKEATRRLEYLGKTKEPIYIILNSVGGGVYDGLLVFDTIKRLTEKGIPIVTEARGLAASMGSIILQAGTKRLATPHTRFLIHEVSTFQWGETSKLEEQTEELRKLNDMLNQIYAERTGKTVEQISKLTKKTDYWLSVGEALEFGLIDEIIQHGSPSFDFMKQFDKVIP